MTAPAAADIASLPKGPSQFQHVWKHLYCSKERWDLIVLALSPVPKDDARRHGCTEASHLNYYATCESCRAHVLGDHDRSYEPAYREALDTAIAADRRGVPPGEAGKSALYLGDNGVTVAVHESKGRHQVRTAYRTPPRGAAKEEQTHKAFFRAAERKFRDKLGWRR